MATTDEPNDDQPQRRFRPLRRTSTCQVPTLGEIGLQEPTFGDVREVATAVDGLPQTAHDEQFANALLARMIVSPELSAAAVAALPDDVITPLVDYAVERLDISEESAQVRDPSTPRARLTKAFEEHQHRLINPFAESVATSFAPLTEMHLGVLDEAMKSLGAHSTTQYQALLEAADPARNIAQILEAVDPAWKLAHVLEAYEKSSAQQVLATVSNAQLTAAAYGEPIRQLVQQTGRYIGLASDIARFSEQTQLIPKLAGDLARIGLPEPLLSDSLLISGLNSRRSHTPSYHMPVVRPMETPEEVEERAEEAIRQRLSGAYDTLVVLERRLRRYVAWRLEQQVGSKWWRQRVPPDIRTGCNARKVQRETPDSRPHEPIQYMFLGELKTVICKGDNWAQVFGPDFHNERGTIDTMFLWLEPVRKDVAHPRDFSDVEYQQFRIAAEWLLRHIDRARSAK